MYPEQARYEYFQPQNKHQKEIPTNLNKADAIKYFELAKSIKKRRIKELNIEMINRKQIITQ